jgi:hypothetical protein
MVEPQDQASPLSVDDAWDKSLKVSVPDEPASARIAVGTPGPTPVVTEPGPAVDNEPEESSERPTELSSEERSPLSFVMSAAEPSTQRQQDTHDMSLFVAGLVAESTPIVQSPGESVMEPVMRRARKRRQLFAASAIAATILGGAALGVGLASNDDAPAAAAGAAPVVASPVAELSPSTAAVTPSAPESPTPSPSVAPASNAELAPTPNGELASANTQPAIETAATPSATRPKKTTAAKKSVKRVATKASTTKKSAKKPSKRKAGKSTATKKTTRRARS